MHFHPITTLATVTGKYQLSNKTSTTIICTNSSIEWYDDPDAPDPTTAQTIKNAN
jgi:hypothetical protein